MANRIPQRWELEREFELWWTGRTGIGHYHEPRWALWDKNLGSFDGKKPWIAYRFALITERNQLCELWKSALHRCPERKEFKVDLYSKRSDTWGT